VITAQPIAVQHERKEVDRRRQQMKTNVLLAKAHGGGWQDTHRPTQRELTADAHDADGG
jgi:outer membrane protein TolC